jgi:hypothetical protein
VSLGSVGSCIGVVGLNHLELQPVVTVRLDQIPWYRGLLYRFGWSEFSGTAACCNSELRLDA